MELPFSQACENNKSPILAILSQYLTTGKTVFEIGSGTAQHAVHFATQLPHVTWQCSDMAANLNGIQNRLALSDLKNLPAAVEFDVRHTQWPEQIDAFFSANTAHIMSWNDVERMFEGVSTSLIEGGYFFLYGPFNYGGTYTSDSNKQFDLWLKHNEPTRGIRDFEKILDLCLNLGMTLLVDNPMPANNRLLVMTKTGKDPSP